MESSKSNLERFVHMIGNGSTTQNAWVAERTKKSTFFGDLPNMTVCLHVLFNEVTEYRMKDVQSLFYTATATTTTTTTTYDADRRSHNGMAF